VQGRPHARAVVLPDRQLVVGRPGPPLPPDHYRRGERVGVFNLDVFSFAPTGCAVETDMHTKMLGYTVVIIVAPGNERLEVCPSLSGVPSRRELHSDLLNVHVRHAGHGGELPRRRQEHRLRLQLPRNRGAVRPS